MGQKNTFEMLEIEYAKKKHKSQSGFYGTVPRFGIYFGLLPVKRKTSRENSL